MSFRIFMPSPKRKFGDIGEDVAASYLLGKGYRIIERNYQKPWAEIDIIGEKDGVLVFFEVKTRDARYTDVYLPEFSITRVKTKKLRRLSEAYLLEKHYSPYKKWQIDVITVIINKETKKARLKHLENAVWGGKY